MVILEHNKSNNSNNGMEINNKNKKYFEGVAYEYLQKHAKYVKRVAEEEAPDYFYETKREMEVIKKSDMYKTAELEAYLGNINFNK
ncbi:MAG: hypothetical protein RBR50_04535 [Candidatus Izemoplasmatales bacterium]|nr:hypothetical protein [Bacteroidales bacterium]MDY0138944.1 hypothetical protein [Candidatus Izemoplasmatales bacterium]